MPDDAVVADCLCIGCEYDLRGLPDDGQCPECGLAVEESRRAFEGDIRIPPALKAVSFLFILVGNLSLVWLVLNLLAHRINVPLGVLGIPIGFGLLRLSRGWRITALVVLGIGGVGRLLGLPFVVLGPAAAKLEIFGTPVAVAPRVYCVAYLVLPLVVIGWMARVLLDPKLRTMGRVLGPRVRAMGLRLCERFQRRMALVCAASFLIGLLLAGTLLLYAQRVDEFLLRRAQVVQSQLPAAKPGPTSAQVGSRKSGATSSSTPQITVELDWGEPDSYSRFGPYFNSTSRRGPFTDRVESDHVCQSAGTERIEGKEYWKQVVAGHGEPLENTEARALDWLHHMDSAAGQTDIRLTCRVPIEIVFKPKAATGITDLKTNRLLQPPYVLGPGEYHLQAIKLSR